jgi:radical SAM superfamily enzyme YgiQ (UPF0313 family)
MRYEGQIYRPFSEANSYLLQCTIGCSHNQCTFCGMYKDRKYSVRSLEEIKTDIRMAMDYFEDVEKIFLCDGDAVAMETDILLEILRALHEAFPSLRHVGTYVGPQSTLAKTMAELTALRAAGLTKVYMGVETGDDRLLGEIRKGVTAAEMLQAGQNLVAAGLNLSSMVLLGIAGKGERAREHAIATAQITNAMKPKYLAALTYTPVPHTPLYQKVKKGEFILPDPFETLEEMKLMIEHISIEDVKFVGAHASNYLPVNGTLQKDKVKMLSTIRQILDTRDMSALRSENMRGL